VQERKSMAAVALLGWATCAVFAGTGYQITPAIRLSPAQNSVLPIPDEKALKHCPKCVQPTLKKKAVVAVD
jgi:hypothetical protein